MSIEKACRIMEAGYISTNGIIDPEKYLMLVIMYFKCDASAYTTDVYPNGGPFVSLDHLFKFGSEAIEFSPTYKGKIEELRQAWANHIEKNKQRHGKRRQNWESIRKWDENRPHPYRKPI